MIEFKNIKKVYGNNTVAVEDFNLKIKDGEFIVFIGTSGSGKTTSMRMINRMIEPTSGQILIDGEDIMDLNPVNLRRRIGYVIQNVGLMPHMTIKENVLMVPKLLKWDEEKLEVTAKQMMKYAELPEDFLDRYPSQLSGGQQQRVGVVRALAANQDIILMDEPFGALDPITRDSLQELVKELQEELGKTIVFVTHDMEEALKLATRIVIMSEGEIIQIGTPEQILNEPATQFVSDFIGQDRLIQAKQNSTTVGEVMSTHHISIHQQASLTEALELMHDKSVDTLLVLDEEERIKGFIDIAALQQNFHTAINVADINNENIFSLHEDDLVRESVDLILKRGYSYVPIVNDKDQLIGIVTRSTFVNIVYDAVWGEYETIEDVNYEEVVVEPEDQYEAGNTVVPEEPAELEDEAMNV